MQVSQLEDIHVFNRCFFKSVISSKAFLSTVYTFANNVSGHWTGLSSYSFFLASLDKKKTRTPPSPINKLSVHVCLHYNILLEYIIEKHINLVIQKE